MVTGKNLDFEIHSKTFKELRFAIMLNSFSKMLKRISAGNYMFKSAMKTDSYKGFVQSYQQ